jgi:Uma2 family endonuclease
MGGAARKLMTVEEFFAWQDSQDERYELVDGVPTPMNMMTGASAVHDRIVTNSIAALHSQLSGGPCCPTTADIALRTKIRAIRRPDVTVTCEPPRDDVYEALEPRMVVEVLAPSNAGVPWDRKMNEYRRHASLTYILLVDTRLVAAKLYVRTASGWDDIDADGMDEAIDLAELRCKLTMRAIYLGSGLEA